MWGYKARESVFVDRRSPNLSVDATRKEKDALGNGDAMTNPSPRYRAFVPRFGYRFACPARSGIVQHNRGSLRRLCLPMNAYLANPALPLFPLSSAYSTHYIIEPGEPVPPNRESHALHDRDGPSFDVSHASRGCLAIIVVADRYSGLASLATLAEGTLRGRCHLPTVCDGFCRLLLRLIKIIDRTGTAG